MLGTAYYSLFLVMGVLYSDKLFEDKSLCFKLWVGGIIGNLALMVGIMPFSTAFGFSVQSHIFLLAVFVSVYFIIRDKNIRLKAGKIYKPAVASTAVITLLICALMCGHVMLRCAGGIATGQSTYGDLAMHMGFVTSIAEQGNFPPEFNLLSGAKLCYPFLIDSLSASLYLLGTNMRTAILYPSFVFVFLLVAGFYFFAEKLTQNRRTAVLSMILFFFGGGFGFAYFLDGAKENADIFTRVFTNYYKTPTNYNEVGMRWANPICDMIIPQRTTMAGWCVLLFAMWLLCDALKSGDKKSYLMTGITAGVMPMIHTHSFLTLGLVSATAFFVFLHGEDKRKYVLNWCLYGITAAVFALPQLMFWTFPRSIGNEQFVRLGIDWVNSRDPYLWFWLKNWGVIALLIIPAFCAAKEFVKRFSIGAAVIFVIAEFVIFQPNEYDNNKLFFVSFMFAVILCADYMLLLYEKLKNIRGMKIMAATVIFFSTFSGILTIAREWISNGEYITFSDSQMEFAEFVKENTDKNAVFLTGNQHLNPVSVLAGRNIYAGSELYVYYHGYGAEMEKRYSEIKAVYESKTAEEFLSMLNYMPEVKYILVTESEREQFNIDETVIFGEKMYGKDGISLYELKYY